MKEVDADLPTFRTAVSLERFLEMVVHVRRVIVGNAAGMI